MEIYETKLQRVIGRALVLILLLALLCGCSDQWYLKKAIKHNPDVFADTLRTERIDTAFIEVTSVDTVFRLKRDTLVEYVTKDSSGQDVKVKYLYRTKVDSFFIEVDCPDQEKVTITKTEQLPPITIQPTLWERLEYGVYGVGLLVLALFLIRLFKHS